MNPNFPCRVAKRFNQGIRLRKFGGKYRKQAPYSKLDTIAIEETNKYFRKTKKVDA